jgi:5-methylcytosine-specific restriction protein A
VKPRRSTGPDVWIQQLVQMRFGGRCARCGLQGSVVHHRKPRRAGGTRRPEINYTSNLLWLCGRTTDGCHGHIESYRAEALEHGWLLHDRERAAEVPVALWDGRQVLLDDEGGWCHAPDSSAMTAR